MASRMAALIDDDTGIARDGAIEVTGPLEVTLTLGYPDITLIAGFSEYPAAIVPQGFDGDPMTAKGTGPYRPEELSPSVRSALVLNEDHDWWGAEVFGGPYAERIEFIDYGTDQASHFAAADGGEVDMVYESLGEFVDLMDTLDWTRSEAVTANTVFVRTNQEAEVDGQVPYRDVRVRRALALAVSNEVCLELGYDGRGVRGREPLRLPDPPRIRRLARARNRPRGGAGADRGGGIGRFRARADLHR